MRCVSNACYDQTYGPPAEEVTGTDRYHRLSRAGRYPRRSFAADTPPVSCPAPLHHMWPGSYRGSLSGFCCSILIWSQLEEGEIDKPRENQYNRCVKSEARTWK
jgi:hypothetical protein